MQIILENNSPHLEVGTYTNSALPSKSPSPRNELLEKCLGSIPFPGTSSRAIKNTHAECKNGLRTMKKGLQVVKKSLFRPGNLFFSENLFFPKFLFLAQKPQILAFEFTSQVSAKCIILSNKSSRTTIVEGRQWFLPITEWYFTIIGWYFFVK